MRDLHTCPICHMDLFGAVVGIMHGEFVKLTCDVISGTGVDVPIVVGAVRRPCCCSTLLGNVFFVEVIPTRSCRMPDL
jgi:hypothetical protein